MSGNRPVSIIVFTPHFLVDQNTGAWRCAELGFGHGKRYASGHGHVRARTSW
jgi:hypothetical protein